jgi:hypothetical protein
MEFGEIDIKHVKGHQDHTGNNLSHEAELNVIADTLTTESMEIKRIPQIHIPTTQAPLRKNGERVTAKRQQMILQTYHSIS